MPLKTRKWDRLGNGGVALTELGLGTAPIGNLLRAISDDEAHNVMQRAWDLGVRYFDTAPWYGCGLAETRVNRFLRDKPREDYVISTKVGRLLEPVPDNLRSARDFWLDCPSRRQVFDYSYDGIMRSIDISLERLGLTHIDILYVHDIDVSNLGSRAHVAAKVDQLMAGGYHALDRLRGEGLIQAFGAGVNEWEVCVTLAERGDFDLFLLAGRYTLLEQHSLDSMMPICEERGIGVIIGGPYNSGILASGPNFDYSPAPQHILDHAAAIEQTCQSHGTRMVDAAFQFPLRHPAVLSVIPGSQTVEQMDSNLAASLADIPDALWEDLKSKELLRSDAPT